MRRLLLEFPHGLGDCIQLTVVLQHLLQEQSDLEVDVQVGDSGKASVFTGWERVRGIWTDEQRLPKYFDIVHLDWPESDSVDSIITPATKAEYTLRRVFRIEPQPELCRYLMASTHSYSREVEKYLTCIAGSPCSDGRFRTVVIHYQGNTATQAKNLDHKTVAALCEVISERGYISILLDWDRRSPLPNGQSIHCPDASHPLWGGIGTGDAGAIAELIRHSSLFIGIDSGPQKVAATTDSPLICVWRRMHPVHYFCLGDAMHIVPKDHVSLIRGDQASGTQLFVDNYKHVIYSDEEALIGTLKRETLRLLESQQTHADVLLAYSCCGDHLKSEPGCKIRLSADDHWRMLLTSMNSWNPEKKHREIVVSIGPIHDPLPDAVFARGSCVVATSINPGHQAGALEAIRQAALFARRNCFKYLVMLADDVMPTGIDVESMISHLADDDYVGTSWGRASEMNSQVFAVCTSALFDEYGDFILQANPFMILEEILQRALNSANRRIKNLPFAPIAYYWHTHTPEKFTEQHARESRVKIDSVHKKLLSSRWIYCRVGYDARPMSFEADGTIGEGGAGMEKEWRSSDAGSEGAVAIRGDHGTTCVCLRDGELWRGWWSQYERMPVVLTQIVEPKPSRHAPRELEERFEKESHTASENDQHLGVVRRLAAQCEDIIEFGIGEGRATSALLAAQPSRLVVISDGEERRGELLAVAGRTDLEFIRDDFWLAAIRDTEMVFINAMRSRHQLYPLLAVCAPHVTGIIAVHGIEVGSWPSASTESRLNGEVHAWLEQHIDWHIVETYRNNNGLLVLRKNKI